MPVPVETSLINGSLPDFLLIRGHDLRSYRSFEKWPLKTPLKEEEENENGPIRNELEDSNGSDENLENPVFMNNNQNFQYQRWFFCGKIFILNQFELESMDIFRPPGSPSQDKRGRARQDRDNQTIKRK